MIKRNKLGQFVKGCKINLGKHCSKKTKKKLSQINSGMKHPKWKGGKFKVNNRWRIYKPNHPFAHCNGYISQSRLIAEKCLGRYLTQKEVIHHINGNKSDDQPENLYLFKTAGKHRSHHGWKNKPKLKSNLR